MKFSEILPDILEDPFAELTRPLLLCVRLAIGRMEMCSGTPSAPKGRRYRGAMTSTGLDARAIV